MTKNDYYLPLRRYVNLYGNIMKKADRLKTLQLFHAGLLVESLMLLEQYGAFDRVTAQKVREDILSAPARVGQFGLQSPDDVFRIHREIFGFSDWTLCRETAVFHITNTSCKLCSIAKVMGSPQPCQWCCIGPLSALCGGLKNSFSLRVESTLWNGHQCRFSAAEQNKNNTHHTE